MGGRGLSGRGGGGGVRWWEGMGVGTGRGVGREGWKGRNLLRELNIFSLCLSLRSSEDDDGQRMGRPPARRRPTMTQESQLIPPSLKCRPHTLPPSTLMQTYLNPLLTSQQSQLNARIQTQQSQNAILAKETEEQRRVIEELMKGLEGSVGDLDHARGVLGPESGEVMKAGTESEGVLGRV